MNVQGSVGERRLAEAVEGRVVLVTGASRGIGEATARKLAGAGATVAIAARSAERLEEIAGEIAGAGGEAHPMPADLSDPEDARRLARDALERFGRVDILVNNAGKSINRSILRSLDRFHDYERTANLNYLGPVQLVLALLPSMLERGRGHIVNVSTAGVLAPAAVGWSAYVASKTAFDVFLRSVEQELADEGIEVTSVYMTLVETEMSAPNREAFRLVPAMSADQAADRICAGIAKHRSRMAPAWARPAAVWRGILPEGSDAAARAFFRANRRRAQQERAERAQEDSED